MLTEAAAFKIGGADLIYPITDSEIKARIARGDPIVIGMFVVPDVLWNLSANAIYQGVPNANTSGHAMVVAGYDDDRGAYRVLNSWGNSWADRGFGWVSYAEFGRSVRLAYELKPLTPVFGARPDPVVEDPIVTITTRRLRSVGTKSVSASTRDHHCSSNCNGQRTRTNYTMELTASPGRVLRNPRLLCKAGPCHGWNAVIALRLEDRDTRAVASWDVWSNPTTWELVADEFDAYIAAESTQRLSLGAELNIPVIGTDETTELSVKSGNRELAIQAGDPELMVNGVGIRLSDTKNLQVGEKVLTYVAIRRQ